MKTHQRRLTSAITSASPVTLGGLALGDARRLTGMIAERRAPLAGASWRIFML
jgi:hypothetical protein